MIYWLNKQNKKNASLYENEHRINGSLVGLEIVINMREHLLNKRVGRLAPRRHSVKFKEMVEAFLNEEINCPEIIEEILTDTDHDEFT